MSEDSMDVLRRFYEAEEVYLSPEGGDFSVIAETLDPECAMIQPDSLPYAGEWRGHEGFERWMIAFGEQWASLSVQEPQFFPAGEEVVFVRSTVVAQAKATGVELTWPLLLDDHSPQRTDTRDTALLLGYRTGGPRPRHGCRR